MLTEMYLALMSHVREDAVTLEMAQQHHHAWKENQVEKKRLETEKHLHYQTRVVEPEQIYEQNLKDHLNKMSELKKAYFKSTVPKKRGILEQWLNQHNEGIQTWMAQTK